MSKNLFSKFPSIEQYRHVIADVASHTQFIGRDQDGKPKYDESIPLPTLQFTGTVKLHGTNAGVGYMDGAGVWAQSRSRYLAPGTDNAGFRAFVEKNSDALEALCKQVPHQPDEVVFLYGEWIGQGIMKNVAICQLSKRFVLFGAKVIKKDESSESLQGTWLEVEDFKSLKNTEADIYNIYDYKTWTMDIDFNDPEACKERLEDITKQVDEECPFAREFGVIGVGEGVVWSYYDEKYGMLRFKVKGSGHQVTKTKNAANTKPEPSADAVDFVEKTVTQARLEQGFTEIFPDGTISNKKIGHFIGWVLGDILKEESDTLAASNLTKKDVKDLINQKARSWILNKI